MRNLVFVLISAVSAAFAILIAEVVIRLSDVAPLAMVLAGNTLGGLLLFTVAGINGEIRPRGVQGWEWVRLFIAALFIGGLGTSFVFIAAGMIGAGKTALFVQLETVFVLTLAVIFLGERISRSRWIAGGIAIVGTTLMVFDPMALQLSIGLGEFFAIMGPFVIAIAIVLIKTLVDRGNPLVITAWIMTLGPLPLILLFPNTLRSLPLQILPLLLIALTGIFRAIAWLAFNSSLIRIGTSRTIILFLAFPLFAFFGQSILWRLAPELGLRLPEYPLFALGGGLLVAAGIIVLEVDAAKSNT